jgi:hypothetical protein
MAFLNILTNPEGVKPLITVGTTHGENIVMRYPNPEKVEP